MRLVGYVRVSTDEQAREGYGLDEQERSIRAWCDAMGHELVAVYRESASGSSIHRPQFEQALTDTFAGCHTVDFDDGAFERVFDVSGLVVAKLDRLTRSVRDFCELVSRFEDAGKALVSVRDSLDTTSASGRLVANIMVSVAQWERETISERTRAGMAEARRQGVHVGRPRKVWPDELVEHARNLRGVGKTYAEVAELLDLSPRQVRGMLAAY